MDAILQFLIDWGYWGLFLGFFYSRKCSPVQLGGRTGSLCRSVGLRPGDQYSCRHRRQCCRRHDLLLDGTSGQYGMDREIFHVKKEKMDRAERFVHGRGAWMAFFAFIPILGSAISIVLGMMRANIWIVILAMTIGKILRYALLVWGVLEASALMH